VEDGTGVEDATAYIDLSYARDHHESRGQLSDWDGSSVTTAIAAAAALVDALSVDGHPFEAGDGPVRFTGADLPAPLAIDTDYWLVPVDDDAVQVAASYADAIAASPVIIDLTTDGSGAMAIVAPNFDAQRQSIIKATDHIERTFGDWFKGVRASSAQGLSWPRAGAYDAQRDTMLDSQVPDAVKKACAEYALLDRTSASLVASPAVISESKSSGGISKAVTYASPTTPTSSALVADRFLRSVMLPPQAVRA
jgi:hypothetical protein